MEKHESIITQFTQNLQPHKEWFASAKEAYYSKIVCPFKQELLTVAWDPERVLDWCVDAEELGRVKIEWTKSV
jgi:hypothetical protein